MENVKRDHDAFQQQRHSLNMQCRTTARANEQRVAQEKQQLEQQQRTAREQQRRQQDAARESESRQRQAEAEQERVQRESTQRQQQIQADAERQRQAADMRQRQQEQLRQQDLQRQQEALRQQVAESQRQQLAVAQQQLANLTRQNTQPSVTVRPSDPVAISAPVRTAIEVAKNSVEINSYRKDAKEVASDPSQLPVKAAEYAVEASNDARRNALDRVLNPRGDSSERMNVAVAAATKSNSQIQEARFGEEGKFISQVGNDAISGVGSVANRVLGEFDRAMAQANSAMPNNAAVVAGASSPIASSQVPTSNASGGYVPRSISPPIPPGYSTPGAATSAPVPTVSSLDALNGSANRPNANSSSTNNPTPVQGTTDLSALLGGTDSPKRMCAGLPLAAQSACLIKQCTTLQFTNHSECKGLSK